MFKSSLLAAAMTVSAAAHADVPDNFVRDANAYLDSVYQANQPGVSVIVVDDGKIVLHTARGLANVETGEALTADSVFRIGSITKQFTATAIMRLAEQGKISLTDKLSKYLPDYPDGDSISIHQLLNHTSGVKSYTAINGWMVESNTARNFSTEELIAEFKDQPVDFRPGEKWAYDNSGYVLLGAVIEKVTGESWHDYVTGELTGPLGIDSIQYRPDEAAVPNMAQGYASDGGKVVPAQKIHPSVPHAAGALLGTVEGLAEWTAALHGGKLVSAESLARMTTPTKTYDGETSPYGYALQLDEVRGYQTIGHGGGIFGFITASSYFPKEDVFVAVFMNSTDVEPRPGLIAQKLGAMAIGDPYPEFTTLPVDAEAVAGLLGRYKFKEAVRDFTEKDGKLYMQRDGGRIFEVYPAGDGVFHYGVNDLSYFTVGADEAGTPTIDFHAQGATEGETGKRIGDVPAAEPTVVLSEAEIGRLLGTYTFPFGDFTVSVNDEGKIVGQLFRQGPVETRPISANVLLAESVGARLTFTIEGDRAVSLTLEQGPGKFEAPRKAD